MTQEVSRDVGSDVFVAAVRHHLVLILACGLLGLAAGWYLGVNQTAMYTSSAQIYLNPLEGNPYGPTGRTDDLTSLETEAEIVRSDTVMKAVSARSGLTQAQLQKHLQVTVPTNTQLLDIAYQDAHPQVARETASAFAGTFLDYRAERAEALFQRRVANIDVRERDIVADLESASRGAESGVSSPLDNALRRALNSELINLRAQRVDLVTNPPTPGRITQPASDGAGGGHLLATGIILAATLTGLILGLSLAIVLERRRGRVWNAKDVRASGLSVLADIPGRQGATRAVDQYEDGIRRVRASVMEAAPAGSIIALASWDDGLRRRGLAGSLAASLARAGKEVVLVAADLHQQREGNTPTEHRGLAEALAGDVSSPQSLLLPGPMPGVWFLPGGRTTTPGVGDYFVKEKLSSVLRPLASRCDYLLVLGPGVGTPECEATTRAADGTVLVITPGLVRKADLAAVVTWAESTNTPLLGAVILAQKAAIPRPEDNDDVLGIFTKDDIERGGVESRKTSSVQS